MKTSPKPSPVTIWAGVYAAHLLTHDAEELAHQPIACYLYDAELDRETPLMPVFGCQRCEYMLREIEAAARRERTPGRWRFLPIEMIDVVEPPTPPTAG